MILHLSSIIFGFTMFWSTIFHGPTCSTDSSTFYYIALVGLINCAVVIFFIDCWWRKSKPTKTLLTFAFGYLDGNDSNTRGKLTVSDFLWNSRWEALKPGSNLSFISLTTCLQMKILMFWSVLQTINAGYPEVRLYFRNVNLELSWWNILQGANAARGIYFQILFHVVALLPFNISTFCMFMIGKKFQEIATLEYAVLASPSPNGVFNNINLPISNKPYLSDSLDLIVNEKAIKKSG